MTRITIVKAPSVLRQELADIERWLKSDTLRKSARTALEARKKDIETQLNNYGKERQDGSDA